MTMAGLHAATETLRSVREQLVRVSNILEQVDENHPRRHKRHSPGAVKILIDDMIEEIDATGGLDGVASGSEDGASARGACTCACAACRACSSAEPSSSKSISAPTTTTPTTMHKKKRPHQPRKLDAASFPHILERIVQSTDFDTLLSFRATSRTCRVLADRQLFEHVAVVAPPVQGADPELGYAVSVAVGPGGYALTTPTKPWRFLPSIPSIVPTAPIRVVDYYGRRPSPRTLDFFANLAHRGVDVFRCEATWAGERDWVGARRTVLYFPLSPPPGPNWCYRTASPATRTVLHVTWPPNGMNEGSMFGITNLHSIGSSFHIVIGRPDTRLWPAEFVSILGDYMWELFGEGLGELWGESAASEHQAAPTNGTSNGTTNGNGHAAVSKRRPQPGDGIVTIVGLEFLAPSPSPAARKAYVTETMRKIVAVIARVHKVPARDVEARFATMSHAEWSARNDAYADLELATRLPFTSDEVAMTCT